ncbi:MerR family transcriptional regulator [Herbaspirillum sp. LeCh32-8]|uniref:MerR family transcriptional regulator n=1 Tax=Herbaspirillum sp. LeCh32-8 TaxID=2821356 RepID=UPI001AE7CCE7|nr:MerR family transcriptional regulator [Herbaspirillum sp. LeCh32-8]MBP0599234.1 MerR family transcriptional regulator [Herbaspirillum sp. LeCh32-8]
MTTSMTIAQAAAATGLSVHTLRYYERIGLLDPVERRDNSHRRFTQEDLNWIGFLLKLKATGLPVRAMLRYAELRRLGNSLESVKERKAILLDHTLCVQHTLAELQSNLAVLHQKIALYGDMEEEAQQEANKHATAPSAPAPRKSDRKPARSGASRSASPSASDTHADAATAAQAGAN